MNAFLLYVMQSTLCLSLFYGLYLLLLRREAFFRFNRYVLLSIMIISMVVPLIHMPVNEPALMQLPMIQLEEKVSSLEFDVSGWAQQVNEPELETSNLELETPAPRSTFNMIPLIYLAGLIASLILAIVSIISVLRIIVTARPVMYRQQKILVSPMKISSFTFAGWIVLSEMDYERFAAEIVTHEDVHRREGHFWDLCLAGVITVLHWFNPLAWLLQREIKTLHEYEADRSTLTQGINATRYQLLLIEKAAGASRYSVASSFAQSKIKKRISMMNKQNPKPWARWKALLFIPLAALLVQAFARPDIKRELEQISTLKSTENIQENTGWNEDKFFEELRKCLPENTSRELSNKDIWELALENAYPSAPDKMRYGCLFMMNRHGDMAINYNAITSMEKLQVLLNKHLGDDSDEKVLRVTHIEISVDAPADAHQQMLDIIGNTYMAKRNVRAQKRYQTDYVSLNEVQKTEIDKLVPMLISYETTKAIKYFDRDKNRFSSVTFNAPSVSRDQLDFSKKITDDAWAKATKELDAINNREISYNGKTTKIKDVFDLLRKDTNANVKINNRYQINNYTGELDNSLGLISTVIDPKAPVFYYVMDGKWVYGLNMGISMVKSISTYPPDVAVKRYGNKATNGAIVINTKE